MAQVLTESQYKEVKSYYITHKYRGLTKEQLAERFGLSYVVVGRIINSRGYANYLNKYTKKGAKGHIVREPIVETPIETPKTGLFAKIKGLFKRAE